MSPSLFHFSAWTLALFGLCTLSSTADPGHSGYQVHVSAGAHDRQHSIVSTDLPFDADAGAYRLESQDSGSLPAQVDKNGTLWFVIEDLAAGSSQSYSLHGPADPGEGRQTTLKQHSRTLALGTGEGEVLHYYHKSNDPPEPLDAHFRRGGYIHPVYSPSGVVLTDHLNPDQHTHHSGIWSAWTNTEFDGRTPDFWNVFRNSGRVDIEHLEETWSGPVHAGFRSLHAQTDLSADEPLTALNELWEVRVYNLPGEPGFHLFDLVVTQTANTGKPLILPEYRYGGIGFRGHADWTDNPESTSFLTSDGLGRDGHATRARWCHIGGYSEGELAGVAILGHPQNFRFPQPMRIHPHHAFFNFAPTQLGDMRIDPGTPLVQRLRFVTYDGEADPERIENLWQDYAYPPGVTITTEPSPAQSPESR